MKTKNILKIGILGIVLFALLVSPILKSNSQQIEAASKCEEQEGTCISPRATSCNALQDDYIESPLSCVGASGKTQCCIKNPDPGTTSVGQRSLHAVEIPLQEERADDLCKISFDDAKTKCGQDNPGYFAEQECKMQVFFTYQWCQIVKGILEGFGKMFAGLINLEIDWILKALNPNFYGGIITNPGVQTIWKLMRNFTNALLVLGFIWIAIATILGYKKYAWKQVLWKLILVALLVNFSLVIAGIIVDTSNYLTAYFLSISQENNESIAPRIMEGYGYTKIETSTTNQYDPPAIFSEDKYKTTQIIGEEDPEGETESYSLRFGSFFIISFVMILVGGFAVIALLTIFLTIIVRNFLLIILLGLSPIVFAAWIFPDTEKYWKMWWSNFLKWSFFPVIFAFTLYLALTVMNSMPPIGTESPMAVTIIRMVLFSMFLVGGLIFSLQSGGAVSQFIMKQANETGATVRGFVGTKVTGAMKESSTYKKAGGLLTKIPLLGGVGQEMMVAGEKAKAGRVKEHEKNLENVGLGSLKQLEKARPPSPLDRNAYERRVALTNKLADMGELSKESVDFIKMHRGDGRLDAAAITKAIPHHFKMEEGQLVETGKPIKLKAEALSRIKSDKMRDKTQSSDFIKDIVEDRKNRAYDAAIHRGKTEEQAKEFAEKTADSSFDKTVQEIIKTLSPAQMAAFWHSLSNKDLIEKGWGGLEGKIIKAIKKDDAAKMKFEQHLNDSKPLRAESGIDPEIFNPKSDTDSDTDSDKLKEFEKKVFK